MNGGSLFLSTIIAVLLFLHWKRTPKIKELEEEYVSKSISLEKEYIARNNLLREEYEKLNQEYNQQVKQKLAGLDEKRKKILAENEILSKESARLMDEYMETVNEISFKNVVDGEEKLVLLKNKIKDHIKGQTSKLSGDDKKQMRQIQQLFMLQSLQILEKIRMDNNEQTIDRLVKCYTTTNALFVNDGVKITKTLLDYRIEEAKLTNQIMIKKYQEKEEEKERKQFLREQLQAEKEMNAALKQIDKDRRQFDNEIKRTEMALKDAKDESVTKYLLSKIEELKGKLAELKSKETDIDYRLKNARAGFVYIISNIGSFGERVFKIGMTRRLDPYERIRELSSASVPYNFDVHAIIFSEDAPSLEDRLHKKYADNALNLVNPRKEFFRIEPEELKRTVYELDRSAKFNTTPDAEDFYASEKMRADRNK